MIDETLAALAEAARAGRDEQAEQLAANLDRRAVPGLRAMLSDAHPDVRWWAVRALAAVDADPPLLAVMLEDKEGDVRACAALALASASYASPPQAEAVIEALVTHLADPDPSVARLCALALARIGPAASPALARALEQASDNVTVRIYAARALSSAATPEAIPALVRALDDASVTVQYYAEEALERLGVGLVLFKP